MNIKNHWFSDIIRVPSPNFNDRPNEKAISLIVIHCISLPPNEFEGDYIDDLFCNRLNPATHSYFQKIHTLQVSAHLLIRRNGDCRQYVALNKRAWHAGISSFQGHENCNDFSIGIELEGSETLAYTQAQYKKLNEVIIALCKTYPTLSHIAGHCDIAPERKTDPGASFDWSIVTKAVKPHRNVKIHHFAPK